jgi:cytochrome c
MRGLLPIPLTCIAMLVGGYALAEGTGDPINGAALYKTCKSCHQIGAGAKHRIGPHLNGVFGRAAGGLEDFKYSKSMQAAGGEGMVWTADTLDAFLENPKAVVAKTRMSFRGVKDATERQDILAYIQTFSENPSDIPEAEPTAIGTDHSVDPAILALQGDAEYGEYLASECKTCHQVDGSNDGIPGISGWPTDDFIIAMFGYKEKTRPHPVMQMMAGRLSGEEIAALAAYFKDLE